MTMKRREFLKTSGALAPAVLLPTLAATAANTKLRTAHIGVGGMGRADLNSVASHPGVEVTALCDVDSTRLAGAMERFKEAKGFRDYREMLDKLGDKIDAVVVSTPDHTHAPAAMTAMNLGKPVYCQKPLTHEVFEAQQMRKISEKKKLVTQMGIQIHSHQVYRQAVKMIQTGAIGPVSEVHAWSSKNWGYDGKQLADKAEVPDNLDWNLWIGTAKMRPYVPGIYHPGSWRKTVDFGTGTLGDMGVHIFDTPYGALQLTTPNWVKTTCRAPTGIGHPEKNIVEYEFPGTKYTTDKLTWKWYDGRFAPPKSKALGLPAGVGLPGQGALFVGEKGFLLLPHISPAKLYPVEKFKNYKRPSVAGANHYHQWVDACLGKGETSASFSYAGPLTESLLLGVVANRFPNRKLEWNSKKSQFTNSEKATELVRKKYRQAFVVKNL